MLPLALVRARARGDLLVPRFVDPTDALLNDVASELVARFQTAAVERWSRARLDEDLADLAGILTDRKLFDGLRKICSDRTDSESTPEIDPVVLRAAVFRAARARGPIAYESNPLGRPVAAEILAEVGADHGLDAERIASLLYADLPEADRITGFDLADAEQLLLRYNLGLAQGMLLAATRLTVRLHRPPPARIRQLLRWARFHQLIQTAHLDGDDLIVALDGPLSMFQQSTRYGLQLASFLPALILQDGGWTLEAELRWTPRRLERRFHLDHKAGLTTSRPDTGGHQTREEKWFEERFAQTETPWTLAPSCAPLDLGGRGFAVPDFTLQHGNRVAHLEILGFWRPESLAQRLDLLRRYGPGNVIVAVSRKMCADKTELRDFGPEVVAFSQVVPVRDVLAKAEELSR